MEGDVETTTTADGDVSSVSASDMTAASQSRMFTARLMTDIPLTRQAWTEQPDSHHVNTNALSLRGRNKQSLWLMRTKRFCYEASVVGLRYVANPTASPFRRSIWLLLLLAGAAFTTLQIHSRIRYFLTRPVSVNLRYQHVDEMRFPTVTVCNENRATYSAAVYFGKSLRQ